MDQNFIENSLIILTKHTLDVFLKEKNPADLIALYTFYYYTAKWQETNKARCTTGYVAKGLSWTENRVRKVKKQLISFGLIEDVTERDENNKISGHYIKLKYKFKQDAEMGIREFDRVHPNDFAEGGNVHSVEMEGTNAYSANSLNAYSASKGKASEENKKNDGENSGKEPVKNPREEADVIPYEKVKELYNEICISMSPCVRLGSAMRKHIKARFNEGYTMDDFKTAFEKAEASSFCKGGNKRGWKPTFSWFIEKSDNMAKVLNGKYDDNKPSDGRNDKGGGTGNFDDWNNLPNVTNL